MSTNNIGGNNALAYLGIAALIAGTVAITRYYYSPDVNVLEKTVQADTATPYMVNSPGSFLVVANDSAHVDLGENNNIYFIQCCPDSLYVVPKENQSIPENKGGNSSNNPQNPRNNSIDNVVETNDKPVQTEVPGVDSSYKNQDTCCINYNHRGN